MKKDIFRAIMALFFACLAIVVSSYIYSIKHEAKMKSKEYNKVETVKNYGNTFKNTGFNLPVVVIDTNGNQVKIDEDIKSNITIYDSEDEELNYIYDIPKIESQATISIRGNSTKAFPKKQYSIDLINKDGKEKKEELLGMSNDSDWVLNGPFADKSLMRNYIAYNISNDIMGYAPDVKFCEVFLVDDNSTKLEEKHYKGVYIMVEKIKRSEDRVDISKSQGSSNETSFIISKDRTKSGDISVDSYGSETHIYEYDLNINYPKKNLTKEKYEYISQYISEFERILYSDKFNDPINGYEKYIDVDSFVDYYIINEFLYNGDAGLLSTYFYKDYNEKMNAGPVWDFNESMGNFDSTFKNPYEYAGFFMIERSWFDRLMEDVRFSSKVVNRYKSLRKTFLSDEHILNLIDETKLYLGDAANRNFSVWPIDMCNQAEMMKGWGIYKYNQYDTKKIHEVFYENEHLWKDTAGKAKSYDEEIELLKNFIVQRGKWMDENIDSLKKWSN